MLTTVSLASRLPYGYCLTASPPAALTWRLRLFSLVFSWLFPHISVSLQLWWDARHFGALLGWDRQPFRLGLGLVWLFHGAGAFSEFFMAHLPLHLSSLWDVPSLLGFCQAELGFLQRLEGNV